MSDKEHANLTHLDEKGAAKMVDVSDKQVTKRIAKAEAVVSFSPKAYELLKSGTIKKGDAIAVARVAGIQAAKMTPSLIPLCHSIMLSSVTVGFHFEDQTSSVTVESEATSSGMTGVEMEALSAASVAALTLYDMCKGVDKGITIERIRLISKSGGKSGDFEATD